LLLKNSTTLFDFVVGKLIPADDIFG